MLIRTKKEFMLFSEMLEDAVYVGMKKALEDSQEENFQSTVCKVSSEKSGLGEIKEFAKNYSSDSYTSKVNLGSYISVQTMDKLDDLYYELKETGEKINKYVLIEFFLKKGLEQYE